MHTINDIMIVFTISSTATIISTGIATIITSCLTVEPDRLLGQGTGRCSCR